MGERWGCGALQESRKCAILAHNPLFASIVNQQSLPQEPPFAIAQTRDSFLENRDKNWIMGAEEPEIAGKRRQKRPEAPAKWAK